VNEAGDASYFSKNRDAGRNAHLVEPVDHDALPTYLASRPTAGNSGILAG
jgi:hypothetical protein